MTELKAIEVCEIGQIAVMGIKGQFFTEACKECILLGRLLKVAVKLHWNSHTFDIYVNTTVKELLDQLAVKNDQILNREYFPQKKSETECKDCPLAIYRQHGMKCCAEWK